MKRLIPLILAVSILISMTACGGIKIPEGMNCYEYDTTPNDETGWDVELL